MRLVMRSQICLEPCRLHEPLRQALGCLLPLSSTYTHDVSTLGRFPLSARRISGGATMMAALILLFSLVTLFMFFVSYCRRWMASSARHELSEEVRDVTGIKETPSPLDYDRVVQILQLCPERPEDRLSLRAVNLYHSCLKTMQGAVANRPAWPPKMSGWSMEQASCRALPRLRSIDASPLIGKC